MEKFGGQAVRNRFKMSALAIAGMLAGCGSGGSGGSAPPTAPSPTPTGTLTPAAVALCNSARTLCWPTASPAAVSAAPSKPKIIFLVMLDDADYNDFGYFSTDAVTPNIDSIARDGVRLSRYYAGSAICSPSRAAMLTGQSPMRYGLNRIWDNKPEDATADLFYGQRGLPSEDSTLADGLRAEGYKSYFVGKWHLGTSQDKFLPGAKGFDSFAVQTGGDPAHGSFRAITENGRANVQTEWQSKYAADQIISFIDRNLANGDNTFVTWWPPEPHTAVKSDGSEYFYIPPTFDKVAFQNDAAGKSVDLDTNRGKLVSMLYSLDSQLGRVLNFIKERNVYEDSLIIVTSDNGGHHQTLSPSHELLASKATVFEGGLRVPFTVSWPKRFKAGTHTPTIMSAFDVYPTILGLIGGAVPTGIEGQNLSSVLLNGTGTRDPLFFQLRTANVRGRDDEAYHDTYALIDGCHKIVRFLSYDRYFNVCDDPNERTNLRSSQPSQFANLQAKMLANRLRVSQFFGAASVGSPVTLSQSERLNVHQDDLSIYATANLGTAVGGTFNLYRRGDGTNLRIENGQLVADIVGVADATRKPAHRTVSLAAPIPLDGNSHRLGLTIRGYFYGGATISLYVDGEVKARLRAPINVNFNPGGSVMAVKSEVANAQVGSSGVTFSDVVVHTLAIEPDEF
ncbi:MAG: sulfatase [Croceibacterium sp.]